MNTNTNTAAIDVAPDVNDFHYDAGPSGVSVRKGRHSVFIGEYKGQLLAVAANLDNPFDLAVTRRVNSTLTFKTWPDGSPHLASNKVGLPKFSPKSLTNPAGYEVRMVRDRPDNWALDSYVEVTLPSVGLSVDVFLVEQDDEEERFSFGLSVCVIGDPYLHVLDVFFNLDGTFSCAG